MRLKGKKFMAITLLLTMVMMAVAATGVYASPAISTVTMTATEADGDPVAVTLAETVGGTFSTSAKATDLLKVYVTMTDPATDPQATILVTYEGEEGEGDGDGGEENWAEIIYAVDQMAYTTGVDPTFTFKLKAEAPEGIYKLMVGGTNVATAYTGYFKVGEDEVLPVTLENRQGAYYDGPIAFTISNYTSDWEEAISEVKVYLLDAEDGNTTGEGVTLEEESGYVIETESFEIVAYSLESLAPKIGATAYCRLIITSDDDSTVEADFELLSPVPFNRAYYLGLMVEQLKEVKSTWKLSDSTTINLPQTITDTGDPDNITWSLEAGAEYFELGGDAGAQTLGLVAEPTLSTNAAEETLTATISVDGNVVALGITLCLIGEDLELGFGDASADIINAEDDEDKADAYLIAVQKVINVLLKKASANSVPGGLTSIAVNGTEVQASDVRLFRMMALGRFTAADVRAANQ